MLDIQLVNNNFYYVFVRICGESYPTKLMALDLRGA